MIPADPQQLPDDVDALKAMIFAAHAEKALADQEHLALQATIAADRAEISVHQAEIAAHEAAVAQMNAAKTADVEKIACWSRSFPCCGVPNTGHARKSCASIPSMPSS